MATLAPTVTLPAAATPAKPPADAAAGLASPATGKPLPLPGSGVVVDEQRNEAGELVSRTTFKDGVPHGEMIVFAPGGRHPAMQAEYVDGVLQGVSRSYDDKGQLVQEAGYRAGKQHGITRLFNAGKLLSEQRFVGGVLQGETVSYSEAGQVTSRLNFRDNDIEGEAVFMHEGSVVRRAHYRKNLLDGEVVDFDRDAAMVQSAHYKANLLDGMLRRYWPDGQVMEELQYKAGKPMGKPRRFNKKGAEVGEAQSRPGVLQRLEDWVKG